MLRHSSSSSENEERISSDNQPLLSQPNRNVYKRLVSSLFYLPKGLCVTSKAAVLILSWTVLVGALFIPLMGIIHFCVVIHIVSSIP